MLSSGSYINGLGMVSPQGTKVEDVYTESFDTAEVVMKCKVPDYKGVIEPNNIRRLSSILKMSVYAAKASLADSGETMPDAIVTGTGLGCIEDTEKFLKSMIEEEGASLSPSPFIFSTHNTISGQVAIAMNCTGYNSTYVHRANSFESALADAVLHLRENKSGKDKHILVGGVDEITPTVKEIYKGLNFLKEEPEINKLFQSKTNRSVAGEGATFFILSDKPTSKSYARLDAITSLFNTTEFTDVKNHLEKFLKDNHTNYSDIDLVMLGNNGDQRLDHYYKDIATLFPSTTTKGYFKHLCGDYFTSSAFGLYVTALGISKNLLPESCIMERGDRAYKKVLFYNQFQGSDHSFYLLSHV